MLTSDVIRAAIPNASDELCEQILWERTPFPVGSMNAKSLYRAASRWQRAIDHGLYLCLFCDNLREKGQWTCAKCDRVLSAQKEE